MSLAVENNHLKVNNVTCQSHITSYVFVTPNISCSLVEQSNKIHWSAGHISQLWQKTTGGFYKIRYHNASWEVLLKPVQPIQS